VESPLHTTSELCAGCHQVFHYEEHTPFQHTYAEWKKSMYAINNIQCQDCHMVDIDTFKRSADNFKKPKKNEYHHYFNGTNFLMYFLGELRAKKEGDLKLAENFHHKYEMAVERLQAVAELDVKPIYNDKGKLYKILVRVHNRRAGHNLPTSLTNIRQMWLEVLITDKDGNEILKSGFLDEKGKLDGNTYVFNSDGMGYDMSFQIDPWEVVSFSRHDTIPPKGYRDVYYTTICDHEEREIKVQAKLRFRQVSQAVAEKLLTNLPKGVDLTKWYGLAGIPAVPVVDMVEQNATFQTKGEPSSSPVQVRKDTLFHKLGGAIAVNKAVDLFYNNILADDRLSHFFAETNMTRQRRMMSSFLAFAFNGPDNYKWKNLKEGHKHLVKKGLSEHHFDLFVGHMESALKEIGVKDELIKKVAKVAMSKKNEILGKE
jgi:truncated hemoglobin YjbI